MSTSITTNNRPAPVPGAPPSTPPAGRRVSAAGYWVGALVAVLSMLVAMIWGAFAFLGWQAHVEDFPRLNPPGTMTVSVSETETQYIYLEHPRSTPVPDVPSVTVTGPSGVEVPTVAFENELRYDVPDVGNRVGDAVLTFEANETGTYLVAVGDAEQGTTIAIGDNLIWGWGLQVVGIVALLLGGLLIGVLIVLITAVRRA